MSPKREVKAVGKGVNETSKRRDAEAAEQSAETAPQVPDPNPPSQNKRNRPPLNESSAPKRRKPSSNESLSGDALQGKDRQHRRTGLAPFNNDLYKNSDALANAAKVGEVNFTNYLQDCKEDGILQLFPSLGSLLPRLKNKYRDILNCPEHTVEFLEAHFNRAYTWYCIANGLASTEDLTKKAERYWKKFAKENLWIVRDNLTEATITIRKADKDGALAGVVEDLEKCHLHLLKLNDKSTKEEIFFSDDSPLYRLPRIRNNLAAIYTEEMTTVALNGMSRLNLVFSASSPEDTRAECFTQLEARSALLIGRPSDFGAPQTGSAGAGVSGGVGTGNKKWMEIPPFRDYIYSPQNLFNIQRAAKVGKVDYNKHCQVQQLVGGKKKVSSVYSAIRALRGKYEGCEGCLEVVVEWVEVSARHFEQLSRAVVDIENYEQKSLKDRYTVTKKRLCSDLRAAVSSFTSAQKHGEGFTNVIEAYETAYEGVGRLRADTSPERFLSVLQGIYVTRGSYTEVLQRRLLSPSSDQTEQMLKSRITMLRGEDEDD